LLRGGALGESEVGDEYLSKNSLIPLLTFSILNWVSLASFPGATNITVASGEI
jgi:hypothetical protein